MKAEEKEALIRKARDLYPDDERLIESGTAEEQERSYQIAERLLSERNDLRSWSVDDDGPREPAHKGHYSLMGTYWCDTCNSPYCVNA